VCEVGAPTFSDMRLTDGGKVVSPTRRPPLSPGNFLVLISVKRLSGLQGHSVACSIVPPPTTLPRAPRIDRYKHIYVQPFRWTCAYT
jgi:hypothetical protein